MVSESFLFVCWLAYFVTLFCNVDQLLSNQLIDLGVGFIEVIEETSLIDKKNSNVFFLGLIN